MNQDKLSNLILDSNYFILAFSEMDEVDYVNYDVSELPMVEVNERSAKSRDNVSLTRRENFIKHKIIRKAIRDNKNYIIFGEEGIGKTELAKYILQYRCVVIERMEDFKHYDPQVHSGIIFENIDFSDVKNDVLMCLIERHDRIIKLQNREVKLDKNVRLIFTTRIDKGKIFGVNGTGRSIYRKMNVIQLTRKPYTEEEYSSDSDEIIEL